MPKRNLVLVNSDVRRLGVILELVKGKKPNRVFKVDVDGIGILPFCKEKDLVLLFNVLPGEAKRLNTQQLINEYRQRIPELLLSRMQSFEKCTIKSGGDLEKLEDKFSILKKEISLLKEEIRKYQRIVEQIYKVERR